MLRLTMPGDAHSVLLFWNERGQFVSWYIDLETQTSRALLWFDSMDQMLDIVVAPDLSWWRWKDEDELEEGLMRGIYSPEQARQIRAEGDRALARLLAVTIRERDSMDQTRVPIANLVTALREKLGAA